MTRAFYLGCVLGILAASGITAFAQSSRLNDTYTSPTIKAELPGIEIGVNEIGFKTPDRSAYAPVKFSFYRPGIAEPTDANVMWWYCDETGGTVRCVQKINWYGTVLPVQDYRVTLP
jgi:hypothetical protein